MRLACTECGRTGMQNVPEEEEEKEEGEEEVKDSLCQVAVSSPP